MVTLRKTQRLLGAERLRYRRAMAAIGFHVFDMTIENDVVELPLRFGDHTSHVVRSAP